MPKKERPLPKPQSTPFRKKGFDQGEDTELLADRIAKAMAEGNLGKFLKQEIPESEYARKLVSMMMGMTGMFPAEGAPIKQKESEEKPSSEPPVVATRNREDVLNAVRAGDVKELMELLKREHEKRISISENTVSEESRCDSQPSRVQSTEPSIEKEVVDRLIKIAFENNVSFDWIILRALKLYVEEYQKNGKL